MLRAIRLLGRIPTPVLGLVVAASAICCVIAALIPWWSIAIVMLLVCQLGLAAVVIAAVATISEARSPSSASTTSARDRSIREIEHKLDLLSSRTVTTLERTRTELMTALEALQR